MAPIVIDLISSSPSPSKGASPALSPPPRQLQAASSVPSVAGLGHESDTRPKSSANEGVMNLTTQKRSSTCTGIEMNWSDFDEINDSAFDLLDEPQPKRRKIPGAEAGHRAPFDLSASHRSASVPKLPPLTYNQRPPTKRREPEPITFTSSLGETQPKSRSRTPEPARKVIQVEHDDPFLSDPFETPRQPVKQSTARRAVSFDPFMSSSPTRSSKVQDLANISKPCRPGLAKRPNAQPKQGCESDPFTDGPSSPARAAGTNDVLICIDDSSEASSKSSDDELPSIMDMDLTKQRVRSPMRRTQSDTTWSSHKAPKKTRAPKKTTTTTTRPKQTAAEREAEKENKRREREQLKAEKMVEKHRLAALAEVNKLRTDKKVSTPEMIVDLPSGLDAGLQIQIAQMLQGLGVEHTTWSCPNHSMIKWRRKVISKFNQDMGRWEPIPQRIVQEEIALVIFVAEEFVSLALQGALPERVSELQRQNGRKKLIFLLQGLTAWSRKNRSIRNRKFTSGVRAADDVSAAAAASSSRPSKARAAAAAEYISEDIIEDAMLSLQVEHGILLHHTAVTIDTAKWVINFTQHISTIPYRKQRDQATSVAGFCMESGQVRTGDDAQSTYLRMLQEIVRITGPIAHGVAGVFKTVTELVHGLEEGGPETLAEVKKVANKDGALTDRNVGQAVSRRVHRIFTSTDENSTDV
ncbi:hypothetical protein E4U57_003823 [Claviceps arundinis]|uniref:ERCC4 domain-containing protein n=1 Tax=Claviceps arundinis TaxID=1623583 RepID=A0ABQ7P5X6_9HYPO|nr:hypothetical protein E4U57_003823 [Claviceps arundinis]